MMMMIMKMMRAARTCQFCHYRTRWISLSQTTTKQCCSRPLITIIPRRHDSLSSDSSSSSSRLPLENKNDSTRSIHSFSFLSSSISRTTNHHRTAITTSTTTRSILQVRGFIAHDNNKATAQQQQQQLVLSHRNKAELESRLITRVGNNVQDTILNQALSSLGWLSPRLQISSSKNDNNGGLLFEISLTLPSLLHPNLQRLKKDVQLAAEMELAAWQKEKHDNHHHPTLLKNGTTTLTTAAVVQVKVLVTTVPPVPLMARLSEDPNELLEMLGPGLANVAHFVAVYSCKGGVGKSTVAVNLAYQLARAGGRIGLLDLDIYGPSLPVLIRPNDVSVRRSIKGSGMVYPIEHCGVKVLSMGFVNNSSGVPGSGQDNGAAIMRGPMAGKVVTQLLKGTDWGELDVLLLDLPPGTGDVQLAVCQELALSGAVAVTTPSKLAAIDTRKGIEMFTSLGVPTLAVVENMSYFECEGGGKHYPFGKGLSDLDIGGGWSGTNMIRMPISTHTHEANDTGEPLCLVRPEAAAVELNAFQLLAENVSRELLKIHYGATETQGMVMLHDGDTTDKFGISSVHLNVDLSSKSFLVRLFSASGAVQKRVSAAGLRARDPKTGNVLEDSPFKKHLRDETSSGSASSIVTVHKTTSAVNKEKDHPSLSPTKVVKKGRYGYAVQWADGATIIYSKLSIAIAAGGTVIEE